MRKPLLSILILLLALDAAAVRFVQQERFSSGTTETLREELWLQAESAAISGEALEDLFLTGGVLDLRGTFRGDVWAAGDQIIAAGRFDDQARLAARTLQVSGRMNRSLTAAGNTVKIDPGASIEGNLLCMADHAITEGTISGHARILAKRITLGGKTAGDVTLGAQEIVLLPGTEIGGDLRYTAPKELILSPTVHLGGQLIRTFETLPAKPMLKEDLAGHFILALAALVTGLVFCAIFPGYTSRSLQLLRKSSGQCLLAGLGGLILIPLTTLFLMLTLLGLPLGILLILFYSILLYLGKITAGLWIGSLILRRKELTRRNRGSTLAAGLLILYGLTAFTAIAPYVNLTTVIAGLGALQLALFKKPVLIIQTPADLTTNE